MTTSTPKDIEAAEKPKPRECKTVPEILAHYPSLQDYLSTVDMDEVVLASHRGLGLLVHAYAQDGFRTVGDQIRAVVTAYCENTRHRALAAAREEGRRDMQDECAKLAKDVAGKHERHGEVVCAEHSIAKDISFFRSRTAMDIAAAIRNLPTNAPEPEGESDGWNYDISQAPKSLKDLPDEAMIILAHEAPNGVWWAKTGIWDETSNRFMPLGGSWEPTAFRIITLPTKKGE